MAALEEQVFAACAWSPSQVETRAANNSTTTTSAQVRWSPLQTVEQILSATNPSLSTQRDSLCITLHFLLTNPFTHRRLNRSLHLSEELLIRTPAGFLNNLTAALLANLRGQTRRELHCAIDYRPPSYGGGIDNALHTAIYETVRGAERSISQLGIRDPQELLHELLRDFPEEVMEVRRRWPCWINSWVENFFFYDQFPLDPEFPLDTETRRHIREQIEERGKKTNAAEAQATTTLLDKLTEKQREQFKKHRFFDVEVSDRGTFRIFYSRMFNVRDLNRKQSYCAIPHYSVLPVPDIMLAQKLVLENAPEEFFKVANSGYTT